MAARPVFGKLKMTVWRLVERFRNALTHDGVCPRLRHIAAAWPLVRPPHVGIQASGDSDVRVPHQHRNASDVDAGLDQPATERAPQVVRMYVFQARPLGRQSKSFLHAGDPCTPPRTKHPRRLGTMLRRNRVPDAIAARASWLKGAHFRSLCRHAKSLDVCPVRCPYSVKSGQPSSRNRRRRDTRDSYSKWPETAAPRHRSGCLSQRPAADQERQRLSRLARPHRDASGQSNDIELTRRIAADWLEANP